MSRVTFQWVTEYTFAFTALAILKTLFFPLVLWWWFAPGDLTTTLQEVTFLIIAVVCVVVLLSLGSSSRFRYQLTLLQVISAYTLLNSPLLFLSLFPGTAEWSNVWCGILGDGIQLWWPSVADAKAFIVCSLGLLLILTGRRIRVRDREMAPKPSNARLRP